jgi:flagellar motor switch/type III secretory pathway protein FliN
VKVSPFLLLKRSTAVALAERASAALSVWGAAWAELPDSSVTCVAANAADVYRTTPSNWRPRSLADGGVVWVHAQTGLERALEQILFDLVEEDPSGDARLRSSIATDVAADALEDLLAGAIFALTGQASSPAEPAPLPDRLFRTGAGTLHCSIGLADKSIKLLVPGSAIKPQPGAPSAPSGRAVVDLHDAIAHLPVDLNVELSGAEVTLGALGSLAIGDVITLPDSLEQPVRVTGANGATMFHGHLGSLAGFHAIEVVK